MNRQLAPTSGGKSRFRDDGRLGARFVVRALMPSLYLCVCRCVRDQGRYFERGWAAVEAVEKLPAVTRCSPSLPPSL